MRSSILRYSKVAVILCAAMLPMLATSAQSVPLLPSAPSALFRYKGAIEAVPIPHEAMLAETSVTRVPPAAHEGKVTSEIERNTLCESGEIHGKLCRVSWFRVLGSSFFFLAAQHGGNLAMDDDARTHVLHASFWQDYVTTLHRYRWSRWNDDDPIGVDYVGHPIMGAVTNAVYEQHDPKQRALQFENSRRYWMGRLRATTYSAVYSAQWKIGPVSESSIGNVGIGTYYSDKLGRYTNETGMVDFFVTPAGGLLWNLGEDYVDKNLFRRVTKNTRNRLLLFAASLMTPCKTGANILRFRAPYYRDLDAESARLVRR